MERAAQPHGAALHARPGPRCGGKAGQTVVGCESFVCSGAVGQQGWVAAGAACNTWSALNRSKGRVRQGWSGMWGQRFTLFGSVAPTHPHSHPPAFPPTHPSKQKREKPRLYLDGYVGSGKSVALYSLVAWARAKGWLALYLPSAFSLIQSAFSLSL